MSTIEEMIKDLADRFDANGKPLTEEQIRAIVKEELPALVEDDAFARKLRFGGNGEPELIGSKFSRWGLNTADIEWLHSHMSSRKQRGLGGPSEELNKAFDAISDAYYLSDAEVREIDRQALDGIFPRVPKHEVRGLSREQWVERQLRAMDTAESGYGSQLIGAQYVGDLWEVARNLGTIAPRFRSFEMTAPTAYLPVEVDFPEVYYVAESTANNSSNYSTSKTGSNRVSVTAQKFVLHQMWSGEMDEDSIIPFVPFLRAQAAKALAFYLDSMILNGDTTNGGAQINSSSDPADTKHYLAFDGLRHAALVDNTGNGLDAGGNAITLDTFRALRAKMRDTTYKVDWGHPIDRNNLLFIADPDTADRIDLLDDVVNAKLMSGNSADLLNGQTASILGHPIIRTFVQSKALATGFIHASTGNDYGQLTAVNVNGGVIGWRRRVKQETERLPATDQDRIVYSMRLGFGRFTPTGAASGIEWVASAFNLSV